MSNSTETHNEKKRTITTWTKFLKRIISWRRAAQAGIGLGLYLAIAQGIVSLGWVIVAGSVLGIVLGKFFCRWMCPMGFFMEMMMGAQGEDDKGARMYQYFKLGCPIAWVSGLLNRFSLLKVKLDRNACTSCGKCDTVCYITSHNENRSLHVEGLANSSAHYSCSRCLNCVKACPTGALGFSPQLGTKIQR